MTYRNKFQEVNNIAINDLLFILTSYNSNTINKMEEGKEVEKISIIICLNNYHWRRFLNLCITKKYDEEICI